jgi:hypothetical protein
MSDSALFVDSMVVFPEQNDPEGLGLLLVTDANGIRLSLIADPDWVRTALVGMGAGADLRLLEVPDQVTLPIAAAGWPEDWAPADQIQVEEMVDRRRACTTWAAFRDDVASSLALEDG